MLKGKMCIGVVKDEMMCRIGPRFPLWRLRKEGAAKWFLGRPMKGYVFVVEEGMKSSKDFDYWINLCVEFNNTKDLEVWLKKSREIQWDYKNIIKRKGLLKLL